MEPQVSLDIFITFYKPSLADLLAHDGWAHQHPAIAGGFWFRHQCAGTPSLPNISVAGFSLFHRRSPAHWLVTTFMACAMCSAHKRTAQINAGASLSEKDRLETLLIIMALQLYQCGSPNDSVWTGDLYPDRSRNGRFLIGQPQLDEPGFAG